MVGDLRVRKGFTILFYHLSCTKALKTFLQHSLLIVNLCTILIDSDKSAREMFRDSITFISDSYGGDSISLPNDFNIGIKIVSPEERIKPNFVGSHTSKPGGYRVSDSKWLDSLMSTAYHRLPCESYLDTTGIKPALPEDAVEFDHVAGRLHFLREKRMKVRTTYLPRTEYQEALLLLDQGLERVALKGVCEDCTFNQDEGALLGTK
jgi:hypothetical protein